MRIAIGQMEVIPGRPDLNAKTMLRMIDEARGQAQIIVFPALCLSGSCIGDTWEQQAFIRDCQEYGQQIIVASENIGVIFGNVAVIEPHTICDAVFTAYRGSLLKPVDSSYAFWLRRLDNDDHFTGLRQLAAQTGQNQELIQSALVLPLDDSAVSLGCLSVDGQWPQTGFHDTRSCFAAPDSAQLLIHPNSTPFALGRGKEIDDILTAEATKRGTPLIYVNNTGIQNKGKTVYIYNGGSAVYYGNEKDILRCPAYESGITPIQIDQTAGLSAATAAPSGDSVKEIYDAIHYGTKKFLSQTGIERVVIGASGGIDSAVNAALFGAILDPEQLLLVNMPSRYNSSITRDLAAELAANLGCRYTVMPIQESVDYTIKQIEESKIEFPAPDAGFLASGKAATNGAKGAYSSTQLSDERKPTQPEAKKTSPDAGFLTVSPSVAENIQARDRSARILAAVAAAFGGVFTCNANKSETTVGYSTLYGDMAGFLAPLADLWKHQVYQLAAYLNQQIYQREVIPQKSVDIKPSAELSPEQAVEEGKGDPLHYPYHDYLFKAFMENRATPEDLLEWYGEGRLEERIGCAPGLAKVLFRNVIYFTEDLERWWKLYTGFAVAKRIQSPPTLSISRRAYGSDHREAQNSPYFTKRYLETKERLLWKLSQSSAAKF